MLASRPARSLAGSPSPICHERSRIAALACGVTGRFVQNRTLSQSGAVRGDDAYHGRRADVVELGHLGSSLAVGDNGFGDLAALGGIELLAPAADAAFGTGGSQASGGAFRIMARS